MSRLLITVATITLVVAASFLPLLAASDEEQPIMKTEIGQILLLSGPEVEIEERDSALFVAMVAPVQERESKFRDVDIEPGDRVLMANGKRVESLQQLADLLEPLEAGETIQLGIRRGKDMLIASFPKVDVALRQIKRMTFTGPPPGGEGGDQGEAQGGMMKIMTAGGAGGEYVPLVDAALLLKEDDGKVVVAGVIDNMLDRISGHVPEEGEHLIKVQDTDVTTLAALQEQLAEIAPGTTVTATSSDGESEFSFSFKKSASQPKVMMQHGK